MSYNATRLTCFALISAIETDCREALLAADVDDSIKWPSDAEKAARDRIDRDRKAVGDGIEVLVQYLDFADSYQVLLANKTALSDAMRTSLATFSPSLQELIQVRNRVAHSRPMEIGDLAATSDTAKALVSIAPGEWETTAATLARLQRDPAFVLGLTVELPADPVRQPQHNLPIPDFDETGFFGRSLELKRIKKALLGAYPVVSVLGDGGIGKTAIALKVAYDLLDAEDQPFDAIVWATAKSTTLTNSEIADISGAIQDSLGLFEAAAQELAGVTATAQADPMEELLEYLAQFKVLLILDNLETVTDQRLRSFLLDLPLGSKVLLTSRIGLGIENPVKLEPLSIEESKRLLRTLAGIRGIDVLKMMPDDEITKLVSKLRGHPLYIKWLVAGVQTGRRPAELVNDNSLLLDFCMSNVWDKLGQPARSVLQSMQIARGQRNLAELAYLTAMSADTIQGAVLDLMTTNFVSMRHAADADLEGAFETGEFASQYLARHQPPTAAHRSQIAARVRELEDLGRDLMAENRLNPFDPYTIDVRDRTDVPTARLLHAALRELRGNTYDIALIHCSEAQILSPTYGEVWRVQGLVHHYRQDLNAAALDYERALEYANGSAVMAFHVANFYADGLSDVERAVTVINDAVRAHPKNPVLLFSLGEYSFRLSDYRAAVGACSILAGIPQTAVSAESNAILCLRAAVFGSEQRLWDGDLSATVGLLEDMTLAMQRIGAADMDDVSADLLMRLADIADRVTKESAGHDFLDARAEEFRRSFEQRARVINPSVVSRSTGQIKHIDLGKRFGFISSATGDLFFHRDDLIDKAEWNNLDSNTLVAFDKELGAKGARAVRVRALL